MWVTTSKPTRTSTIQRREGQFDYLLESAKGFADSRNEIAHGIVFRIDQITLFREHLKPNLLKREHYALIPPLYAARPHKKSGLPGYAYTALAMERIAYRLMKLQAEIRTFHSGQIAFAASPHPITRSAASGES